MTGITGITGGEKVHLDELVLDNGRMGPTGAKEDSNSSATGPVFTEEEKSKLMNNAVGFLVDSAAAKAKTYLTDLVDKAESMIDKEVKKGTRAIKSYEKELNQSDIVKFKPPTKTPTALEKAAGGLITLASKQAKKEIGKLVQQGFKEIAKEEDKLAVIVKKSKAELVDLTIERNKNSTRQAEAERKKILEAEARRNATLRAAAERGDESNDNTAKCELVTNLPCGGTKGSKSYMTSYNSTIYSIEQYRKAMNEFYGMLPILGVFHEFENELPPLKQCINKFKAETCNVMFPKCTDKCEVQKPCESSCTSFGKCSAWFSPALLNNMQEGGDHFNIVEGVVGDKSLLNIISDIVESFTSKCTGESKAKFYELKENNAD
jgi:hypothetical protein